MNKMTARSIALKILNRLETSESYTDKLLESDPHIDKLSHKDKALVTELVNGITRYRLKLDWVLKQIYKGDWNEVELTIKNVLRLGLYQMMFLDKIPNFASVDESVKIAKSIKGQKAGNLANAVLRNYIREKNKIVFPNEENIVKHISVNCSHPEWIIERWVSRYGKDNTIKLCEYDNKKPFITLRVNKLKSSVEDVKKYLIEKKIEFVESLIIPEFIKVRNISGLKDLEIFEKGFVSVQDESSGLIVKLLAPKSDELIIDLCSAPGGKTTYIAELTNNESKIIAVDKYINRLKLLQENILRLGIKNILLREGDARIISLEHADKILADVPCSGFGVLQKRVDLRWQKKIKDIQNLQNIQLLILENSAKFIKIGGCIVYSTCTIEPEENENVIKEFLRRNKKSFILDNAEKYIDSKFTENGFLKTYPQYHNIDGVFGARLIRTEQWI
jgi:16S rRNA (cytosine967-C5)-methyltransferase